MANVLGLGHCLTIADLLVRWCAVAPDPTKNPRSGWTRVHIRCTPTSHRTACGRAIPFATHMEDNGADVPGYAERCAACFKAISPKERK